MIGCVPLRSRSMILATSAEMRVFQKRKVLHFLHAARNDAAKTTLLAAQSRNRSNFTQVQLRDHRADSDCAGVA